MGSDKVTKPSIAGTIYGEVARWMLFAGMVIAIIGTIIYFTSGGYLNQETLITNLWNSCDCNTIWKTGALGTAGLSGSLVPHPTTQG